MLNVTKPADDRIEITLSDALSSDDMREGLDALIEKSEDISHGVMLYTITDFAMPTLGAFAVEMARLPKLFGLLGKFDKCAVLTDSPWLRTAAEVEGLLFPGMDIKGFAIHQKAEAEAWLANAREFEDA